MKGRDASRVDSGHSRHRVVNASIGSSGASLQAVVQGRPAGGDGQTSRRAARGWSTSAGGCALPPRARAETRRRAYGVQPGAGSESSPRSEGPARRSGAGNSSGSQDGASAGRTGLAGLGRGQQCARRKAVSIRDRCRTRPCSRARGSRNRSRRQRRRCRGREAFSPGYCKRRELRSSTSQPRATASETAGILQGRSGS